MLADVTRRRLPLPERGVEIALLDWGGEGPLALLHHANGFCAATLDLVARPLRAHFRVVGMDGRGHGDSSTPDGTQAFAWKEFGADLAAAARILAAAGGRIALGLGHSFGGTSMLLAAAEEPRSSSASCSSTPCCTSRAAARSSMASAANMRSS